MSKQKQQVGACRICGKQSKLTYEHVPPKAAFNKQNFYVSSYDQLLRNNLSTDFKELTEFDFKSSKKEQGGIGFYTLCKTCNNNTGAWYGNEYVKWIYMAALIMRISNNNPIQPYKVQIFPCRIIKQIISMFFSLNYDKFHLDFPLLTNYILHKNNKNLDSRIRVFCYYNIEGTKRYSSNSILGNFTSGKNIHLSEITFPPIGLVMTIDSNSPDERLTEITQFASYGYDEEIEYTQRFNLLPTHFHFPGDYRSKAEIESDLKDAEIYLQNRVLRPPAAG